MKTYFIVGVELPKGMKKIEMQERIRSRFSTFLADEEIHKSLTVTNLSNEARNAIKWGSFKTNMKKGTYNERSSHSHKK